jgi:hypothetical protein
MTVQFPDYVEAFIEDTKGCLGDWDVKLIPDKARETEVARVYQARTAFGTTELALFPVRRPDAPNDYRAFARTPLPKEWSAAFADGGTIPNGFATLGALISGPDGPSVWSQCLIYEESIFAAAATMAAAMVYAAPSIIETMRRKLIQEEPELIRTQGGRTDIVWRTVDNDISAWSDADFERLQRKRPDLAMNRVRERRWIVCFAGSNAFISLAEMDNHPYFGGGLFSLLCMPNEEIELGDWKIAVDDLNFADGYMGEAPTFGAWCADRLAHAEDRQKYEFVSFAPNLLKAVPDFLEQFIDWNIIRARSIKQVFEFIVRNQITTAAG